MTKTKLLVIEDVPNDKELLGVILDRFSFDIVWIETGKDAKEAFLKEHFDAVLMDLGLPDMQGTHLIRWFHAKRPEVPVCIVTGNNDPSLRLSVYEAGAVMVVNKNFTTADNIGLLALLDVQKAAVNKERGRRGRYTTRFGMAAIGLASATVLALVVAKGIPEWTVLAPIILAVIATGAGLMKAADAYDK